jgi:hypothetical protein
MMRIIVAGKDKTMEIGGELTRRAARHQGALSPWSPADSALSLKTSCNRADYLERFSKLLMLRYALCTEPFPIPGKSGIAGGLMKKIKAFLWKLLRYQHDRMAHQQNAINELIISAQVFQIASAKHNLTALEQRVKALESELKTRRPPL